MADYFTNFSLMFSLPDTEAQTYVLQLAEQAGRLREGDQADGFPSELADVNWCFDTNAETEEDRKSVV